MPKESIISISKPMPKIQPQQDESELLALVLNSLRADLLVSTEPQFIIPNYLPSAFIR